MTVFFRSLIGDADLRTFGFAENHAEIVRRQLGASHTRGLAPGHPGDGRRYGRRDAAGAAPFAAGDLGHEQ